MSDPKIDGEPDPSLLCPDPDEAAENYTTDDGEEIAVYEAQVAANGNEGFNGKDGFPLCCACGNQRSEHNRAGQCTPRWGSCNLASGHAGPHGQEGPFKR